jgi:hypothetical protein
MPQSGNRGMRGCFSNHVHEIAGFSFTSASEWRKKQDYFVFDSFNRLRPTVGSYANCLSKQTKNEKKNNENDFRVKSKKNTALKSVAMLQSYQLSCYNRGVIYYCL